MCIPSVHTLLKVVEYYDLGVLSMSVMGFQKKEVWMVGVWVGKVLFWIFGIFKLCEAPYLVHLGSLRMG